MSLAAMAGVQVERPMDAQSKLDGLVDGLDSEDGPSCYTYQAFI